MQRRKLGKTDLELPILSLGASSLGAEFRGVSLDEVFASVRAALELGINFIDTSPFYGRGMSEVLLGVALKDVPRDSYNICTKLGRYTVEHFDFSARRVAESVDVSLHRLGCGHLDIVLCHDIEFVSLEQVIQETIPALRKQQEAGKVRYIGISGYPQKIFHKVLEATDLDCVMSYNQYTLQNTRFADETIPMLLDRGIGVMNAGPFSARLLTNSQLPDWFRDPKEVQDVAKKAAAHCSEQGVDIAELALQFCLQNEDITTTVAGSANPNNIRKWVQWAENPVNESLIAEVQEIFAPVKNIGHAEGLPENN
ncbi:MAG TPA: aldo/keto reductase [Planctomycetaceae bacterium]|nr:aldo/keto reductase [Planctomycetaceae bacterium]